MSVTVNKSSYASALVALLCIFAASAFLAEYSGGQSHQNPVGIPMGSEEIASFDVSAETERLRERIRVTDASSVYEELVESSATLSPAYKHIYGHAFGDALYEENGLTGLTVCDENLYSGCLHQFTSRVVSEYGSQIVPELLSMCAGHASTHTAFSCAHGVGHGVVAWFGYNLDGLKESLASCRNDTIGGEFIGNCIIGAFAEYDTRSFTGNISVRPVPDDGNLYYPCELLAGSDQQMCITMLPHWWMYLLETELSLEDMFAQMGARCRELPEPLHVFSDRCFRGIGLNAVRAADLDIDKARELCAGMAENAKERDLCTAAADTALASVYGDYGDRLPQYLPL
jgi:hypothetical protein